MAKILKLHRNKGKYDVQGIGHSLYTITSEIIWYYYIVVLLFYNIILLLLRQG